MSTPASANLGRMADDDRRAMLLAVPEYGKVRERGGRIFLDFSPEIRDGNRYLWTFFGQAFESREAAESVRQRICVEAARVPLVDAIAGFRGRRSRNHKASDVIDRFLAAAATTPSDRTGQIIRPRSLAAYKAVLRRGRPFWEGMTIGDLCRANTLRQLKGWFRVPLDQGGRGLQSDQEARACFAALRAAVAWYRTTRPDFPAPDWPPMPTALTAKRRNLSRRPTKITFPEVVRGICAIPPKRQPIFWVMLYTGARPTEARGVLGEDWDRPRLTIRRSAQSKSGSTEIYPSTKTGETGTYELPEWLCDLIDEHCTGVRFKASAPLFPNPDARARGGIYSDDAVRGTWAAATKAAKIPAVSVYRAMKHAPVKALRDAGMSIEDTINQYRLREAATLEHYDEEKDVRRAAAVARLDAIVGPTRLGYSGDTRKGEDEK